MSFPSSARVVYEKNPLVEVVCQLRFPPILAIAAHEPADFQERIRQTYPFYERDGGEPGLPSELTAMLANFRMQVPNDPVRHQFLTVDRKRIVSLMQNFVAVSEQAYQRWEVFRQEIERVETAVQEIYQPVFYERVGLRYRDVIDRDRLGLSQVPWNELIESRFVGLLGSPEVKEQIQSAAAEVVMSLPDPPGGLVRVRYGLGSSSSEHRAVYLFDADFYMEGRCTHEQAFAALESFHGYAGNLFRWAIKDKLQHALGPRPVD